MPPKYASNYILYDNKLKVKKILASLRNDFNE